MGFYREKTPVDLTWLENKDRIRQDLRFILRRIENKVLAEAARQFTQAVAEGNLIEQRFSEGRIIGLVKEAVKALPEPRPARRAA